MSGDDPQAGEGQQENEGGHFGEASLGPAAAPVIGEDAEVGGPDGPAGAQFEGIGPFLHEVSADDADGEEDEADVEQADQSAAKVAQRRQVEDQAVRVSAFQLAVLEEKKHARGRCQGEGGIGEQGNGGVPLEPWINFGGCLKNGVPRFGRDRPLQNQGQYLENPDQRRGNNPHQRHTVGRPHQPVHHDHPPTDEDQQLPRLRDRAPPQLFPLDRQNPTLPDKPRQHQPVMRPCPAIGRHHHPVRRRGKSAEET